MKLNYKKTICVGFAFFLISMFWQAYDTLVPKILTDKFGMAQTWSGAIMALDNVFALFLLPIFGALSDRIHSKHGRRTPFIFIGTILAVVLLIFVSVPDSMQYRAIEEISGTEGTAYTESLGTIWEKNPEVANFRDEGDLEKHPLQELITKEDFVSIPMKVEVDGKLKTNQDYTDIVVPARQAVASAITAKSPGALILFIALLFLVLVSRDGRCRVEKLEGVLGELFGLCGTGIEGERAHQHHSYQK